MDATLLDKLKKITPEEQEILDGRDQIDPRLYNLNRSMIVDAGRLLAAGKLIELRPHTRFVHFPAHTHNYVEMVYMCSGTTRHIVNGSSITLQPGELLLLGQNAVQEILPASFDDVAVNFIILPEFFQQPLAMLGGEDSLIRDFLIDCLKNNRQNVSYLHFKVADILPVQNLIENLVWMLLNRQPGKRLLNQTAMGLLLLHLSHFTERMELGKDHFEQEVLLSVFRFIEEHYKDGELQCLAEENGWDLCWLSRVIKRSSGMTYTQLVQEKRLRQAAYLLTETGLSITDISLDIGYRNFSYFYRIFRERYGMSPRAFRKARYVHSEE